MANRPTNRKLRKQLGNQLRLARESKGFTQAFIACRLELTPGSVSRVESGQQAISVNQLFLWAEILDSTPSHIVQLAEKEGRLT